LIWLYLTLAGVKVVHELSHAFACKKFGRLNQSGGEVHNMGVMFLVFVPLPYLDASSAWAFRNKWHRAVVGAAGIMAEFALAAVAVLVWVNTSPGTVHLIAYNVIFVASVSTLLFNGNPLLRFDAYYVLSDLIEMPNLAQRSTGYLYYLVKRYAWGLKGLHSMVKGMGERVWLVVYGTTSTAYRLFISIRILLFLNDRLPEPLFIVVPVFAFAAIVGWLLVPLGRFLHYLFVGADLDRHRPRALVSVLALLSLLGLLLGAIEVPDYRRIEGVVEPVAYSVVRAGADGFLVEFAASGTQVAPQGPALIQGQNPELELQKRIVLADRDILDIQRRQALVADRTKVQMIDSQIEALDRKVAKIESELASLRVAPPFCGTWVAPDIERLAGAFVPRGRPIGTLLTLDESIIRATAGQDLAAILIEQADPSVQMRVKGNPHLQIAGQIQTIAPAGQEVLPSEALGYLAGGPMATTSLDPNQIRAVEKFFEIRIRPGMNESVHLLAGQRVIARIRVHPKPLARKWWHAGRQLFQRRFGL
jgi:putative peptide zinc metalloprotease protein